MASDILLPVTEARAHHKPIIGLLGGIGSGKSLVARQFASLGCGVIDADALAREALDEPAVREQLVRWWGPGVVGADGRADRKAIGRIVFDHPEELGKLESLIHPRVLERRRRLVERFQADPAVVAIVDDTPLLLEKGLESGCDVLVFVKAPRDTRLARVRESRGWDDAELARRESRQWPLDKKEGRADYVLENSGDQAACLAHVRNVLSLILTRTKTQR